jgi:hypothetical protein
MLIIVSFRRACMTQYHRFSSFLLTSVEGREARAMGQEASDRPEDLEQLQRRLAEFRSSQPVRSRLPEPLWAGAAELAARSGVHRTARGLHLDYTGLKKRVAQQARPKPKRTAWVAPTFVELVRPTAPSLTSCLIAGEAAQGGKLRLDLKAVAPAELAHLIRAFLGH